eukprot:CAMPEP_0173112268 /NCGR_PEP_ID=MMETSP1102-20130122/45884_1 /TAXON_ID=49646 /ORGANISM="Geminigera sp., Strain Caron Lab Isolate" /LENGTH=53 /DNA_ID=CAMNT_0014013241 /DNA_START=44 /DNA_END=201 /DNA_ORIENTATION=+
MGTTNDGQDTARHSAKSSVGECACIMQTRDMRRRNRQTRNMQTRDMQTRDMQT